MTRNSKDFRVPEDHQLNLGDWRTCIDQICASNDAIRGLLQAEIVRLSAVQQVLYASNRYSVLPIVQPMDAAGKDGAIMHAIS